MAKRSNYLGVLAIGDPHLEGRRPGFRCDDYPRVILQKLEWCLRYAKRESLLPVLLGDVFDKPRDNPTWMVGRLIELFHGKEVIGIYGNHDCAEPKLTEDDSLSILIKSECYRLVSQQDPWLGTMSGRTVMIGGSSYRESVPERVELPQKRNLFDESKPLIIWLTHHDISVPGYESGRFEPFEIENCELLINGHIHSKKAPVQVGQTCWMTPGNISRRVRKDLTRLQQPRVTHVEVSENGFEVKDVIVPHRPFDEVFHRELEVGETENSGVRFIDGLRELQNRKTESGAGLMEFLERNIDQFDEPVAHEIMYLAEQVTQETSTRESE